MFFFKRTKIIFYISLLFFVFTLTNKIPTIFSQNNIPKNEILTDEITYTFDWETLTLTSHIYSTWSPKANNIYEMPNKALDHVEQMFPILLAKIIDTIPALQNVSLLQFMHQHDLQQSYLTGMLQDTNRTQHIPSEDLFGITITYKTQLSDVFTGGILNSLSQVNIPKRAVLSGIVEQSYTSLVFFVEDDMSLVQDPSNTAQFEPKLLPQVFAKDSTLVYSPEYYKKNTFVSLVPNKDQNQKLPFKYIYTQNLKTRTIGRSPLVIVPLYINATKWPNVIISNEYADRILGSSVLREHIKNGNVFFIISAPKSYIVKPDGIQTKLR